MSLPMLAARSMAGGQVPDEHHRLLLAALLGPDHQAQAALDRWAATVNLDDVDEATYRLLPALSARIERLDLDHPRRALLRGVYRRAWFESRTQEHRFAGTFAALTGIPLVVLKGAALHALDPARATERPMRDLDVLVRPESAETALVALQRAGHRLTLDEPWRASGIALRWRHAVTLRNAEGDEVDLHWHALEMTTWPGADDLTWRRARRAHLAGHEVLVPSPADLLVHSLVHGASFNAVAPVRWVVDAVAMLDRDDFSWEEMVVAAQHVKAGAAIVAGLSTLREFRPVPPEVEVTLASTVGEPFDGRYFALRRLCRDEVVGRARVAEFAASTRRRARSARPSLRQVVDAALADTRQPDLGSLLRHGLRKAKGWWT